MADEAVTPPGATYDVATDTVDGREYQLVKIVHGEDGGSDRVTDVDGLPTQGSAAPLAIVDVDTALADDTTPVALTADTDVRGFSHASVFLVQDEIFTFGGDPVSVSIKAYGSNDSTNWFRVPVVVQGQSGPGTVSRQTFPELITSAPGEDATLNIIPIDFAYLRLMVEPTTGGPI